MIDDYPRVSFSLAMVYCVICLLFVLVATSSMWGDWLDSFDSDTAIKRECPK